MAEVVGINYKKVPPFEAIKAVEDRIEILRNKYVEIKKSKLVFDEVQKVCPTAAPIYRSILNHALSVISEARSIIKQVPTLGNYSCLIDKCEFHICKVADVPVPKKTTKVSEQQVQEALLKIRQGFNPTSEKEKKKAAREKEVQKNKEKAREAERALLLEKYNNCSDPKSKADLIISVYKLSADNEFLIREVEKLENESKNK